MENCLKFLFGLADNSTWTLCSNTNFCLCESVTGETNCIEPESALHCSSYINQV